VDGEYIALVNFLSPLFLTITPRPSVTFPTRVNGLSIDRHHPDGQ